MKKKTYHSFEEARKHARSLGLKTTKEWFQYTKSGKKPEDIPASPQQVYKNKGWKGLDDWLGTGRIGWKYRKYRPFEEARKHARNLGLKTTKEWFQYTKSGKKPEDIPGDPYTVYKDKGWIRMGDWLGTGNIATFERKYRPFKEARKFARSLRQKDWYEWYEYAKSGKKPVDIPSDPRIVYKDKGWISIGDWIGTGSISNKKRKYRPFKEARKFVRSLKLKSRADWDNYRKSAKLPKDIPANPPRTYKKEWKDWGDFFGTGRIANQKVADTWLSAKEARIEIKKIVREVFGGKPFTPQDWYKAHGEGKIPKNIPKYLDDIYNPDSKRNRKRRKKK